MNENPKGSFPAKTGALTGIKILLADDSADNRFLITRILNRSGATVVCAEDGNEAVRLASVGLYDVILMDIQMPGMDGYEATSVLRSTGCVLPIIALTAHSRAEERARTEAAGFSAHLTKPLSQIALIETVAKFACRIG